MRQATACPACNGSFSRLGFGVIAPFVSYRTGIDPDAGEACQCLQCGLMFCLARMDNDEELALYRDYRMDEYNFERDLFEPGYIEDHAHLNDTRSYTPEVEFYIAGLLGTPKSVLDIGGNDGMNTPFSTVADVTIVEVGEPIPDRKFDLVVLAHVLEHVSDPRAMAERSLSLGPVYAEVPVEDYSEHWHEHVQIFNRRSLDAVLLHRVMWMNQMNTDLGSVLMAVAR